MKTSFFFFVLFSIVYRYINLFLEAISIRDMRIFYHLRRTVCKMIFNTSIPLIKRSRIPQDRGLLDEVNESEDVKSIRIKICIKMALLSPRLN